jgi:hypothetical protein
MREFDQVGLFGDPDMDLRVIQRRIGGRAGDACSPGWILFRIKEMIMNTVN